MTISVKIVDQNYGVTEYIILDKIQVVSNTENLTNILAPSFNRESLFQGSGTIEDIIKVTSEIPFTFIIICYNG